MKLWLISQTENNGYDTYDSAVVAAETPEDARLTHPGGYEDKEWAKENHDTCVAHTWVFPSRVSVRLLGEAVEGTLPGVICASFNAG